MSALAVQRATAEFGLMPPDFDLAHRIGLSNLDRDLDLAAREVAAWRASSVANLQAARFRLAEAAAATSREEVAEALLPVVARLKARLGASRAKLSEPLADDAGATMGYGALRRQVLDAYDVLAELVLATELDYDPAARPAADAPPITSAEELAKYLRTIAAE